MGESYHSDFSATKHNSVKVRLFKNDQDDDNDDDDDEEDLEENEEEEYGDQTSNSPLSQELNETTECEEESASLRLRSEFKPKQTVSASASPFLWGLSVEHKKNQQKEDDEEEEKTITSSSSISSPSTSKSTITPCAVTPASISPAAVSFANNSDNSVPRPMPSLKEQFLKNRRAPDIRTRLMHSEFTTKIKYMNSKMTTMTPALRHPSPVLTEELSANGGIETGLMSMMIDAANNGHFNMDNPTTMVAHSASDLAVPKQHQQQVSKADAELFFNNSLMNVSMLDNIQATNNLDFMSSSILMFE